MFTKRIKKLSPLPLFVQKGYSFIELLLVISVMGMISAVSIASYGSYSNSQSFQTTVLDISNLYDTAKSKSISQVKPTQCGASILDGYQVVITIPGPGYEMDAVCGGNVYPITTKKLPANIQFANGSALTTLFLVGTGTVSSAKTVTVNGYGKSKMITLDPSGNISVK